MTDMEKSIKEMEKTLKTCTDAKRRTFLMATINIYSKKLGKKAPYPMYA